MTEVMRVPETAAKINNLGERRQEVQERDRQSDEYYLLGQDAQKFLGCFVEEDLSRRLVSPNDVNHIVEGLLLARGPVARFHRASLDYRQGLTSLLKRNGSINEAHERGFSTSVNGAKVSLNNFGNRCISSDYALESLQSIANLSDAEYIVDDVYLSEEAYEAYLSERQVKSRNIGKVALESRSLSHRAVNVSPVMFTTIQYGVAEPTQYDTTLPLAWQDDALCAQTDAEAFFPEKGGSTRAAKKVCNACDVRAECLEYALSNDERSGIWGGLSERERRRLKRRAS